MTDAGSPAHACHKENGGCHPLESPLRDYPAPPMRQHPEPAAAWGLDAAAQATPRLPRREVKFGGLSRVSGCRTRYAEQHTQGHRLPHVAGLAAAHRGGKGGVALAGGRGGGPQNRGAGGRWPLAGDTDFENSHKIICTQFCAKNRAESVRGTAPLFRTGRVILNEPYGFCP